MIRPEQGGVFEDAWTHVGVRGNGFIAPEGRQDIVQIGLRVGIVIRKLV
jgi:hypothetical protein